MIRFSWKRRSDGEPMAKVRAEWLLTRDDMAGLLIARILPTAHEELAEMTRGDIEEAIRTQLWDCADRRNWWRDEYAEDYLREVTQGEAWEWAMRQVRKL